MSGKSPAEPSLFARLLVLSLGATAGLILAFAEESPPPALAALVALIAAAVVETGPRLSVPTWGAALLGFTSVALAGMEFLGATLEGRLLSGGRLLTYLTCVVMLQRKSLGDLYRIVVLSGMQVALSAVLTNYFWFAVALFGFLGLLIWTLSALLWERLAQRSQPAAAARRGAALRLIAPSLSFAAVAFVVGSLLFTVLPRIWVRSFALFNNEDAPGVEREVGFSERVELGGIGEILESDDLVLEIVSSDAQTGEPVKLEEYMASLGQSPPLLRGSVLYEYANGSWSADSINDRSSGVDAAPKDTLPMMISHEIYQHPTGSRRLFNIGPTRFLYSVDEPRLYFQRFAQSFERERSAQTTDPILYTIWSEKRPSLGSAPRLWPAQFGNNYLNLGRLLPVSRALRGDLEGYLEQIPELQDWQDRISDARSARPLEAARTLSNSTTLANKVRFAAGDFADEEVARLLERHFLSSDDFSYTLTESVVDGNLDPVVDFLLNRKAGHCEYYASALTLLLKVAGLPARLVNGFKGGEFNDDTGAFEVRQLHAHAWVEVWVREKNSKRGGWVTLDPTPGAEHAAAVAETASTSRRRRETVLATLQNWWSNGIFMTQAGQRQRIYGPIVERLEDSRDTITEFGTAVADYWMGRELSPSQVSSVKKVFATLLSLATLAGLLFVGKTVISRRRKGTHREREVARATRTNVIETPWYDRLAAAARSITGLASTPAESGREYASRLTDCDQSTEALSSAAPPLTELYYRVRFGSADLESAEREQVETTVAAIEAEVESREEALS